MSLDPAGLWVTSEALGLAGGLCSDGYEPLAFHTLNGENEPFSLSHSAQRGELLN